MSTKVAAVLPLADLPATSPAVSRLVQSSRGVRGVVMRLLVSRGVAPAGGCSLLTNPSVHVPNPRIEDHVAAFLTLAWAFLPAAMTLFPYGTEELDRMPFGRALLMCGAICLLLPFMPMVVSMSDALVGGLHPQGLRRPLTTMCAPYLLQASWMAFLVSAIGPFPMLQLLATATLPGFYVPVLAFRPSRRKVLTVIRRLMLPLNNSAASAIGAVTIYYWALAKTDDEFARLGIGLAFDVVIWQVKRFTRDTGGVPEASAVLGDGWPEGMATMPQMLMFALSDSSTVALLLVAQLAGALAPVLHPWWTKSTNAVERKIAVIRVGVSCGTHLLCGASLLVTVFAARRGPNAHDLSYGSLTEAQEDRLQRAVAMWMAAFAVYAVAVRWWLHRLWKLDMGAIMLRILYEHTPYVGVVVTAPQISCFFLQLKQMQMLWWVFPENGLDS